MRVLFPAGEAAADPLRAFIDAGGPRRRDGRPWVLANMVASVDGATAIAGESRDLSGPADRRVFHQLRASADAVLAAAGTVRADRYGPARPTPELRALRVRAGLAPVPPIVVVSRSLALDWESPLFREAAVPTVVACPADADPGQRARAEAAGRVIARGRGDVDLAAVAEALHAEGVGSLLCEGGPGLIAQLATARLLDELFLTVSPLLVAGDVARVLRGPALRPPVPLALAGVMEDDGFLFLRYLARHP